MGWLIIITIILAAVVTYFIYILIEFKRANYTRSYPAINIAAEQKELNNIY